MLVGFNEKISNISVPTWGGGDEKIYISKHVRTRNKLASQTLANKGEQERERERENITYKRDKRNHS